MLQVIGDFLLQNFSNYKTYRSGQILILYIKLPGFFIGEQYIKAQKIIGTLSRVLTWNANIIFSRVSTTFFSGAGNICHISMYFFEKDHLSFFAQKKNILRKRNPIFPDGTRNHILVRFFQKGYLSRTFEKNIIFPCVFLRKITFHFPS